MHFRLITYFISPFFKAMELIRSEMAKVLAKLLDTASDEACGGTTIARASSRERSVTWGLATCLWQSILSVATQGPSPVYLSTSWILRSTL